MVSIFPAPRFSSYASNSLKPSAAASIAAGAALAQPAQDSVLFGAKKASEASSVNPIDIYTQDKPLAATVVKNQELADDVHWLVFKIDNKLKWEPGQAIKIISDKLNNDGDGPHVAAYSIANFYDPEKKQLELLVKRLKKYDQDGNLDYQGRCSNYLCDRVPGEKVNMFGPDNVELTLPDDPNINVIAVCGGTGLTPMRAHLPKRETSEGLTMLFYGVPNEANFPFREELEGTALNDPEIKLFVGFSDKQEGKTREAIDNPDDKSYDDLDVADVNYRWGGYIQEFVYDEKERVINMLEKPNTYFLFCGSRPMLNGLVAALEKSCQELGKDWNELYNKMIVEGRWKIESA